MVKANYNRDYAYNAKTSDDEAIQNIRLVQDIYPVLKQLSPSDIRLIKTKESLFNGNWESFVEKLKELTRLNPSLEEVIRRIEELKKLEKESETDLAGFLYVTKIEKES